MEGRRKGGRPRKIWREEVEEDLNIMRMKYRQSIGRGMDENVTGLQGPQRTVVLEKKKENI
jgi:hypothetical protein